MKNLEKLMQRNLDALEKTLDEAAMKKIEKYTANVSEYLVVACEQAFCDGFCLAAKIITEALSDVEQEL